MAPERDEQSIGNKTRISTELQMPPSEMPTPPRYGEVIDLSPESAPIPKPFPDQPDQSNQRNINQIQELTDTELSPNSNFELIKTTDRLSEEGVKMIEEEKQEFIQTGNTEKFYHNVRAKMLPEHMKQSYGANSNWGREAA